MPQGDKPVLRCEFPYVQRLPGTDKFFLDAYLLEDHHTNKGLKKGSRIYSSELLTADFREGKFETLNTIYVMRKEGL
jgi:hypothetical protein